MERADIPDMAKLIKRSGICRSTVRKLYRNENVGTVKVETLIQFCDALHCNLSDLIEYQYEEKTDSP
ncbi:MAG: helix-turn-helix transcriptional regulator [Oscillospiraceae bacterium]|nr:helix-turn-helix transcriptional regulator [Oscillospiraceae bacterium]